MKKVLSILIIFITFIILYFLQSNFFNWFNIAGIKPNLFIILVLFIGIFIGKIYGFTIGVALGLLLDLFIGKSIGINAAMLGLAGILGGILTKNFSKDSRMTIMVMTAGATLICELMSYFIQVISFQLSIEIIPLIKIMVIEILYNSLLIIIMYPLIQKAGNILERIFTKNNILTKYY